MVCCINPDCPDPPNPDGNKFCQACSFPLVQLLINRFKVVRVISGEGGFGRTYLGEDTHKLNETCVIKQLAPKMQGSWALKKAVDLFEEEAKFLQKLGEHPQIPALLAYFEQDNYLYLVQQFVEGENLLWELQQKGKYDESQIRALLKELLPILKYLHQRKVIHRDIKPQNIMRSKTDGRLILIDFGVSKQLTATIHTQMGTMIGSQGYSPIEQMKNGEAYPASDLFALGATCFHLLSGIHPFNLWVENGYAWVDDWRRHLSKPVSRELGDILDKLLKRDFLERYQSTDEVIKDLNPKPSPPQKPLVAPQKPVNTLPSSSKGLKLPLMLGIIALLTIVGSGLGYIWRQGLFSNKSEPAEVAQTNPTTPNPQPSITNPDVKRLAQIDKGWEIFAKVKLNLSKSTLPPANDVSAQPLPIFAPRASLLQVVQKLEIPSSQEYWLQVKVCSVGDAPAATTGSRTLLKPGEQVWLKSSQLTPSNVSIAEPSTQPDSCSTLDNSAPAIKDSLNSVPVEDSLTPSQPLIQPKPGDIPGSTPLPTPNR
jgi:serine/threonine protein kinase